MSNSHNISNSSLSKIQDFIKLEKTFPKIIAIIHYNVKTNDRRTLREKALQSNILKMKAS